MNGVSAVTAMVCAAFLSVVPASAWDGVHCWPDFSGPSWQSCWWSTTPPVEIELRGTIALPPPATWGSGRCVDVVSYRIERTVTPPGEEPRAYARRQLVPRCDGEAVSERVIP